MTLQEDEAICIRRQDYSETSQLVTLFGRTHGKIHCIAKGSRRSSTRFGGGVDLLARGYIQFRPGKGDSGLATLTEFDLQQSYANLRQDLLALNGALLAADLISRVTIDADPHESLYETLVSFLEMLAHDERKALLLIRFELALLREIGLIPNWSQCVGCMKAITPEIGLAFSFEKSGPLCKTCKKNFPKKQTIKLDVYTFLQAPKQHPGVTGETLVRVQQFLGTYYAHLIGHETKMLQFVGRLLRQHYRSGRAD
jgi:DNA repair protein RecO (recombination protein O)